MCTILLMRCLFEEETKPESGRLRKRTGKRAGCSERYDRYLYRTFSKRQISSLWMRTPRTLYGGPPMSTRMTTIRLPRKPGNAVKEHRYQRALQQETVRSRCILRCKQRYPYGYPFHRGGSLAGTLRNQHVHSSQPLRSLRTSSRISLYTTLPKQKLRTTKSWV